MAGPRVGPEWQAMRDAIRQLAASLVCALAAGCPPAAGQVEPALQAVPLLAGEHLALDGRLDHPAWQRAPVFNQFVEKLPVTGAAPPQRTQVQVLFDERAIYVGVRAFDSAPQHVRAPLVRHDQVNRTQDFVVVYIDAIGSRHSAQFFRINAAGSLGDGIHTATDDSEDFAPDFDWDGAVAHNAQGWTAVLRLPFASLRFAQGDQSRWRIMVARRLPRENFHLATSVLIPREAASFIANLQPLQGLTLPEQHGFLTLRPSLTVRAAQERAADGTRRNAHALDASLDVKWRPRAELVLDATLNPDFSQVALDVPQLAGNTRFALSIAEKRPFFFESADLLRTPTEAFYTRSFTEPRAGLRATWRGTNLAGSAFAVSDKGGGLVLLPGPYGTGAADQPGSGTLALRARSDQGAWQLGGVLAQRHYEAGLGDNTVLGPDMQWQINQHWRARAQWLHSFTTALGGAPGGASGLQRGAALDGDRVFVRLNRNTPDSEGSITLDDIGEHFRQDTGFVPQAGVRKLALFEAWVLARNRGAFHELFANLNASRTQERGSGRLVEQQLYPGVWATGANNLEWWLEWHGLAQLRPSAGAQVLRQNYLAGNVVFTPATWFPLLEARLDIGRLADTVAQRVRGGLRFNATARLRPLPALELEPTLIHSLLREGGRSVYDESALNLLAVWHLDARSHLRAIVQRTRLSRLAEAGVSAAQDAGQSVSLTWSRRWSNGSVLYLGASHQRQGSAATTRGTEVFVKWQLDVDEVRARLRAGP